MLVLQRNVKRIGLLGIVSAVPVATYPGTVTPLRGLGSFAESERDVFFGRDRERDELARLVTADGFRAGLLYGEAGVGKSSLLQAGLQPSLRDHGVVALFCQDNQRPLDSLAQALSEAAGQSPHDGENSSAFLSRIIGETGQMYLFILDDVDLAIAGDDNVAGEIAELFTRLASRSSGRARFLFCCASDRVHSFATLEKRTGSLFPPSSRYELYRMQPAEATMVLDRTIALAGIRCQDEMAGTIVEQLARDNAILPADLQIAALALKALSISTVAELQRLGGYGELERSWVSSAAEATGNERSAMRLLAEFATGPKDASFTADWAAARASIDPGFAREALTVLQSRSLVRAHPVHGSEDMEYALAHEILAPRIREISAPAKQSARRAFQLLGSRSTMHQRLSPREFMELRREGIVPSTPEEKAVIDRTIRLGKLAIATVVALPLLILVIVYLSMSKSYYLDTAYGSEGVKTIVVRAGKPGLSWFHWLPHNPAFGSIVADSGLSEAMVTESQWKKAHAKSLSGSLDGDAYAKQTQSAMRPRLANLIRYATEGDGASLSALQTTVADPNSFAQLLSALRPIAQGSADEVVLIEAAMADPSPAVQTEALLVAASAAARRKGAYASTFAAALSSADPERRRLSFSAVRTLPAEVSAPLYQAALAGDPSPAARRELLALLDGSSESLAPSAASATSVLLGENISEPTRKKAHDMLTRAFESDPASASEDAAKLVANASVATKDRLLAMSLLLDFAPESAYASLVPAVAQALKSQDLNVQAAALPLYAHINAIASVGVVTEMLAKSDLPAELQVAAALAWGEIARADANNRTAAQVALAQMLNSSRRDVRAAAARAYGYTGRSSQEELIKMVKKEFIDVAESAAYGLANSTEAGGPTGNAISGIREMWKRKGKLRRIAAEVYARMARSKPAPVYSYLSQAAVMADDEGLHAIGMRGLCNALRAGYEKAGRDLARASKNAQVEVRRIAIECVVDYPKDTNAAAQVAAAMVDDSNGDIRAESARVLANLASQGENKDLVGSALSKMARDDNRGVRVVAIRALASLGKEAPDEALAALPIAFDRADTAEKLAILEVAAQIGAAEMVQLGIADASPLVRVAALDAAISTGTDVSAILNASLTDPDPAVRGAALERLSLGKHGMPVSDVEKALSLAIRDADPGISNLAMMASAQVGDPAQVVSRLQAALQERSETLRVKAAAAALGLVAQTPAKAIEVLEPLLEDPSHDVRVAMLEPLAAAYAGSMQPEALGKMLMNAERNPSRRLVAISAFLIMTTSKESGEAARAELKSVATKGPAFAKEGAALALGLLKSDADGIRFMKLLVP